MNKFLLISISKLQISTEPVWLLSLIVCCALVKSPNTNVRCRIVLHSTFLPSQKRLSTSITFAALNKFRRKLSRLRRMRFTTPRWRVLLYATSLSRLRFYCIIKCMPGSEEIYNCVDLMQQCTNKIIVQLPCDMWNCLYEIVSLCFSRLPVGEEQDHGLRQDDQECDELSKTNDISSQ